MRTIYRHTWILALALLGAVAAQAAADQDEENPFRTARWLEMEALMAQRQAVGQDPGNEQYAAPQSVPITALGVNIGLPPGELPESEAAAIIKASPLFVGDMPRPWPTQVYTWTAAGTRHQPLYFEEVNAERYGYSRNWVLQPAVSTAHFFATLPALPYLMAANCPGECVYTLGHYRAGSCPPYRRHCWPCDLLGGTVEAGTLTWMILVLP